MASSPSPSGSNNGRPLTFLEGPTAATADDRGDRESGEVSASEDDYQSISSDGQPSDGRFPGPLAIADGLLAIERGEEAPWGRTPAGGKRRAPIVGQGPETGGSAKCRSVRYCKCSRCRGWHEPRHDRTENMWTIYDCQDKEIWVIWSTWSRQRQRAKAEARGRNPSPAPPPDRDRKTDGRKSHRGKSTPARGAADRPADVRGRSAVNRRRDDDRGRNPPRRKAGPLMK